MSRTVRDLVVGSDLDFGDRGAHELEGVPETGRSTPPADPTSLSSAPICDSTRTPGWSRSSLDPLEIGVQGSRSRGHPRGETISRKPGGTVTRRFENLAGVELRNECWSIVVDNFAELGWTDGSVVTDCTGK